MNTIKYPEFLNQPDLGDLGLAERLIVHHGLYDVGAYLRHWLSAVLEEIGITKFSQLRRPDSGADRNLGDAQRYSLVICTSDVTRGVLARLP
jgi:NTE family protein